MLHFSQRQLSNTFVNSMKQTHSNLRKMSLYSAATSAECACTQTGWSGTVQTGVIGCRSHPSFPDNGTTVETYCYVNGGSAAKCPCSRPSDSFPGAAYRLCMTRNSDIFLEGLQDSSATLNGVYSVQYELALLFEGNCAFCPVYSGRSPQNQGISFFTFRPICGISSRCSPAWGFLNISLSAGATVELQSGLLDLLNVLNSGLKQIQIITQLVSIPIFQKALGLVYVDARGTNLTQLIWEFSDLNQYGANASVYVMRNLPKITNGLPRMIFIISHHLIDPFFVL